MKFFWAYHVLQSWCFSQRAGDGGGEEEAGVDWGEDCCDREESKERERERERASKYNLVDMLSSICLPYASCSLHGFPPTHGQGQTPTACTPPHRIHTAKQRHFTKINYQNNQPSSPHFTEAISGEASQPHKLHPPNSSTFITFGGLTPSKYTPTVLKGFCGSSKVHQRTDQSQLQPLPTNRPLHYFPINHNKLSWHFHHKSTHHHNPSLFAKVGNTIIRINFVHKKICQKFSCNNIFVHINVCHTFPVYSI